MTPCSSNLQVIRHSLRIIVYSSLKLTKVFASNSLLFSSGNNHLTFFGFSTTHDYHQGRFKSSVGDNHGGRAGVAENKSFCFVLLVLVPRPTELPYQIGASLCDWHIPEIPQSSGPGWSRNWFDMLILSAQRYKFR